MSYNITIVKTIESDCYLTGKELKRIWKKYEDSLPEDCFLNDIDVTSLYDDDECPIKDFQWAGTWSGNSYELFMEILKSLHGTAKIDVVWEDGDHYKIMIDNGKLT